jgi:hypothetical protein
MRTIAIFALSLGVVGLTGFQAQAAFYGWEAEGFLEQIGDGFQVFDVPLTDTDGNGHEFTITEAEKDSFVGALNNSGGDGTLKYGITLPASTDWYFWMRAIGPPTGDNSFFWAFDVSDDNAVRDNAVMNIQDFNEVAGSSNNFPGGDPAPDEILHGWAWYRFGSRQGPFDGVGDATPIAMSAGFHTFHMAIREDGAYVDVFFATDDASFDAQATAPPTAVEPQGKLTTTWASMKDRI